MLIRNAVRGEKLEMRDIEQIQADEKRLIAELKTVRHELREARLQKIKEEFGIDFGVRVSDKEGREYIVTTIDPSWRRPWIKGNPIKKDGTVGKAVRNIYDWTVVQS